MWGWCLWGGRDGGSTWALNYPSSHGPAAAGEHVLTPSSPRPLMLLQVRGAPTRPFLPQTHYLRPDCFFPH